MEKVEEVVTTSSVAPEQVVRTTQRVVTPTPVGVPEHPQQEYKTLSFLINRVSKSVGIAPSPSRVNFV